MPNTKALVLRRLRNVAASVMELDSAQPDFAEQFAALKLRAKHALEESKLTRGNPTSLPIARQKALQAKREQQEAFRREILPVIREIRDGAEHYLSYKEVAEELDRRGIRPPRAEKWRPNTVRAIEMEAEDE